MPKNVGYKPSARRVGSPLTDPRPPKPRNQGDAKSSGPGSGAMKPSIRGGNSQRASSTSGLRTNSITRPGKGTRGSGRTHNSASRT